MGKLVLIFDDVEQVHLGKDVFLVPYYLGKQLHKDVVIVFPKTLTNSDLPSEHRGVKLIGLNAGKNKQHFIIKSIVWILQNCSDVDVLMLFHFKRLSMVLANIFSFLRPTAKIYVKADSGFCFSENLREFKYPPFKRMLYKRYLKALDCVSFETSKEFYKSQTKTFYGASIKDKSVLMPNGFDEELLQEYKMIRIPQDQKERLIITVGRLGTLQKNTEMLLHALPQVKLNGWKVLLIGFVEPNFKQVISDFYDKNPLYRDCVEFVGNVLDKKVLWEYYNRASAFILTSRWEGFALVFGEARRFGNYIISTDVGGASDSLQNKADGKVIAIDDERGLVVALQELTDGKIDISKVSDGDCSWENLVKIISFSL